MRLFPCEYSLDAVEFVEGFDGRQAVDVQTEDLVADLAEYGVIELEEGELHVVRLGEVADFGSCAQSFAVGTALQLLQDHLGPADDVARHACELGDVDAE